MGKNRANRRNRRIILPGHVDKEIVEMPDLEAIEVEIQGKSTHLFKVPHVELPVIAEEAALLHLTALTRLVNVLGHEVIDLGDRVAALEAVSVQDVGKLRERVDALEKRLETPGG